jgi:hypothetical protein
MSEYNISSYIAGLLNESYTIYIIKGPFPPIPSIHERISSDDGSWIRMEGGEDTDLKEALEASLNTSPRSTQIQPSAPVLIPPSFSSNVATVSIAKPPNAQQPPSTTDAYFDPTQPVTLREFRDMSSLVCISNTSSCTNFE